MTTSSLKLRFVVQGQTTTVVAHPVGVPLPAVGNQVTADFNGEPLSLTIASGPQFEYDGHGEETQRLAFVNYFVK
ncbi:hypothetical protein DF039_36900 [Burkholderia cenocepacia]|nr:hypothetical protein DF039_36900 [Burkholderia cenocepacia]